MVLRKSSVHEFGAEPVLEAKLHDNYPHMIFMVDAGLWVLFGFVPFLGSQNILEDALSSGSLYLVLLLKH